MNNDNAVGTKTSKASSTSSNKRRPGPLPSSVFSAGVQQLLVIKEEVSSEWSPSLDQEDPNPIHIKEEQEEFWASQEGEQLHGVEGADINRFPFTAVIVKTEDHEEKPQTSQLHQSQTEGKTEAEPPASSSTTRIKTETDVIHADFQQLLVINKVASPEWSPKLDQEDADTVHIKEELSSEGEKLHGLEDANMSRFPFFAVTVKSEDDGEKPQSSQLHLSQVEENTEAEPPASSSTTQIKTETDREDFGRSEPARNRDRDSHSQPNTDEKASDRSGTGVGHDDWQEPLSNSGTETEDSDSSWEEARAPGSDVNALKRKEALVSDVGCDTGKKPYSCFEYGDGFDYKGSLQRHMLCPLGGNRSSSSLANKKCCGIKQKADSEIIVHTGKTPFACVLCRKKFTHQQSLKRHIRVHTGEKPYGCDVCVKTFKHQESLKRHMRVHTGEKPFGCDVCRKTFDNQQSLKRHMRVHTGEKPFGCDVCGNNFKEQGKLKRHMRVHTGEKPFRCDVCSKRFTHQESLKKHTRIHTGEKPFNCNVCGKRFTHQESLKKHIRIHTGEKPFGCDVCNKTFTLQDSLKKHIRVHTGEKPFGCNVCGKRFTEQGNLNKHTRIHLGEKPFGCSVCSKRFTEQGRLIKHVRVHTGEKELDILKNV
ncbi:zinc finger protein 37-like isoform X2 [Sparus aurata]|uniref:Zinc finger protein 135-like n=1 Tax=Sparus aurata TaxID=8175 RepID=A0A671XIR6_SPAAU|nr:zinc finger protein 37-like isoform X2 [Sparus aurata]